MSVQLTKLLHRQISSLLLIVVTNEARSHTHSLIFTLALELFSECRVNVKRTSKIVIESEKCSFKFTSAKQTQEKKKEIKSKLGTRDANNAYQ